jgi:hypothetical protein
MLSRARYMIEIDARTLALFRILVGLLIIGDVLARAGTFYYFYTEDGVVPQELAQARTVDYAFSFFFFTTSTPVIAALFVLHGLFAVQLILGYRTRLATIISFLFVISLDNANPLITSHADSLFRLLVFWAIFLPLGERWSIDALQRATPPRRAIASIASAAMLFQMIYMYVLNGFLKTLSDAWKTGQATPFIFGLDDMTYFLGTVLRNYPTMLEYGGWLWFGMLLGSPLLLILPGWPRAALTGMFAIAHLSFAVTVRIGGFGWVAMSGVVLFLPSKFWDDLASLAARRETLNRVVSTTYAGLERFGRGLAGLAPSPRFLDQVPKRATAGVFYVSMAAAIVVVYIVPSAVHLSFYDVVERQPTTLEDRIYHGTQIIRITQARWTVFAPNTRQTDRYYVFAARTTDGELLDIYADRPLSFDRPFEQLQLQYGNYRERFYMNSVHRAGERGDTNWHLGEYLCRVYRDEHGVEIEQINMFVVHETITRETIADPTDREREHQLFYRHGCGDREPEEIDLPEL